MNQRLSRLMIVLLAAGGAAGCAPTASPPGAASTAGPAVVVTDHDYDAGVFRVRYPSGWRIVTGPANAPPQVTFVAPDNQALIRLSAGAADAPTPGPDVRSETRQLTLGSISLTAVGSAPGSQWESFQPIFEQVVASLQAD